ncbi:MAG: hypothetical protein JWM31_3438 [Solirubrobacterales bacterium]|nr:hypothetical protein [Solirubrobacterales bacterium]
MDPEGATVELLDTLSLTSLALSVCGIECDDWECDCMDNDATVVLDRPEVERLRDALTTWLERGAL